MTNTIMLHIDDRRTFGLADWGLALEVIHSWGAVATAWPAAHQITITDLAEFTDDHRTELADRLVILTADITIRNA